MAAYVPAAPPEHPTAGLPILHSIISLAPSSFYYSHNTHTQIKYLGYQGIRCRSAHTTYANETHPIPAHPQPCVPSLRTSTRSRSARPKLSASDRSMPTEFRYVDSPSRLAISPSHACCPHFVVVVDTACLPKAPSPLTATCLSIRSSARRSRSRTSRPSTRRSTSCPRTSRSASSCT